VRLDDRAQRIRIATTQTREDAVTELRHRAILATPASHPVPVMFATLPALTIMRLDSAADDS